MLSFAFEKKDIHKKLYIDTDFSILFTSTALIQILNLASIHMSTTPMMKYSRLKAVLNLSELQ